MALKSRWNRVNIILVNIIRYIACSHTQCVNRQHWEFLLGMINFAVSVHEYCAYLNLQFQPLLKVTSQCTAQDRNLLTQLPQHLHQALKTCKSPSICSTIHFSHPVFLSWKMWTGALSTGYGATTEDLRITQGLGANYKKPSHLCVEADHRKNCHRRFQALQHMSSTRNRQRYHQIHNKQMKVPCTMNVPCTI